MINRVERDWSVAVVQSPGTARYADYTRNTSEPIKRIAHSRRLRQAAAIVPLQATMRVLDYGCGDGGFFEELSRYVPAYNLFGYDPYLLNEMTFEGATVYTDRSQVVDSLRESIDVISCMEVFEHLDHPRTFEAFDAIRGCAQADATIVFGVPLETGPSGFAKSIYRVMMGGRQNATIGRAFKALFGIPIPRPIAPRGRIGPHTGFDARAFGELFRYAGFEVVRKHHLPVPMLRGIINNEVYFVCRLGEIG